MPYYKISGVTVLYNPESSTIENIKSYIDKLDLLFVIDNSASVMPIIREFCEEHYKIKYIKPGDNIGVAAALNMGAELSINNSFDFLLTMDQDSFFQESDFEKYVNFLHEINKDKVGIISPCHNSSNKRVDKPAIKKTLFTFTSGNFLNLKIYQKVGPFLNELFIDHIDHEYGLRLNSKGYEIQQIGEITLRHNLGNAKVLRILGVRVRYISHSPLRNYYMIRNGFYVAFIYRFLYPSFHFINLKLVLKELLKIVFLEDEKFDRLKFVLIGFRDYKSRKLGVWKG